jgi:hypothetical protein
MKTTSTRFHRRPTIKPAASTTSLERRQYDHQRIRFALFLKILLTRLHKSGLYTLHQKARRVVSFCARRNKVGDPNFSQLVDSVEVRLRELVGETHWIRSHTYMRHYINSRSQATCWYLSLSDQLLLTIRSSIILLIPLLNLYIMLLRQCSAAY